MGAIFTALATAILIFLLTALIKLLAVDQRYDDFERTLATRIPLADDELFRRFFAVGEAAEDVPLRVRRLFAKHTQYPAEKLLPDDDLAFFWEEMDQGELIDDLEKEFDITISPEEATRNPGTIRALALLVAAKRRLRNSNRES